MTTAILRVRGDVIVMQTMMWPDEIRSPDFAGLDAAEQAASDQELKMARLLVDALAGDFDPEDYEDDYRNAVEALVRAKLEGGEVRTQPEPERETGEVVDLLAALQRSVGRRRRPPPRRPAARRAARRRRLPRRAPPRRRRRRRSRPSGRRPASHVPVAQATRQRRSVRTMSARVTAATSSRSTRSAAPCATRMSPGP
jgi:DNA end-binding protein Ku